MTDLEFVAKIKELRSDVAKMRDFLKQPGHLDRLYDLAIKAGSKKPPKHKARSALPATRLPDGTWSPDSFPDDAMKTVAKGFWAMRKRPDLVADVDHQADLFRDHHFGKGTLAADWPATWRTWMSNALRFNRVAPGAPETAHVTLETWRWRVKAYYHGEPETQVPKGYWKDSWGPKPGEAGCLAPI